MTPPPTPVPTLPRVRLGAVPGPLARAIGVGTAPALPGRLGALWQTLRPSAGGPLRLRVLRDARAAIRLHVLAAALRTGVLSGLEPGPVGADALARRVGATDPELLAAWLRVLRAAGWVRRHGAGWALTGRGRSLLRDDVVDAVQEAFTGFHLDLYRDLPDQLAGGPRRRDVEQRAALIAALSRFTEGVVAASLAPLVERERPARVLDVGCGRGGLLAAMLDAAPAALGTGVERDPAVAASARDALADRGLGSRAEVVGGDLRDLVGQGGLGGGYDVVLLANAVYYTPLADRVALLRDVLALMSDRGVLLVVTSVAEPGLDSAHLDLLMRAQGLGMELPDVDELGEQMRAAGLGPATPRRLLPGTPLVALAAYRA